jgi:hypothetical protein
MKRSLISINTRNEEMTTQIDGKYPHIQKRAKKKNTKNNALRQCHTPKKRKQQKPFKKVLSCTVLHGSIRLNPLTRRRDITDR